MGTRAYAWRVDLAELRNIVSSRDLAKGEQLCARMRADEAALTLPGDDFVRTFQNWQMGGYGQRCSPEDLLALIGGRELDSGRSVHALITLCGLLGECMTGYSFKSRSEEHAQVSESFAALNVSKEEFSPGSVLWWEWAPPVAIPSPEEGLPSVYTIETANVKSVGEKVARRGLDPQRWGRFLGLLKEESARNPDVESKADAFVAEADAMLRKFPTMNEVADEILTNTEEYGLTPENLGYALSHLQGSVEANTDDDAGSVFEEMARWFDEAAAANQGIVLLWC